MNPEQIADLPYRPCAGVMLANGTGQIFVGQRIDSTADAWQMPQGGIDAGEDPRTAALRELFEETGVASDKVTVAAEAPDWIPYDLPVDLIAKLWKGRYRGQQQRWFLMRFHGQDSDIDITRPPAEFSRWKWSSPDKLVDSIVPFKRHVYAQVLDSFRTYL